MMRATRAVVLAALGAGLLALAAAAQPSSAHAPRPASPIFVPGIVAPSETGPGFAAQADAVLAELGRRLAAARSDLAHVVATTVYLADAADFPALNAAFARTWPKDPPTRTTVVATLPVPGARLQVSATAVPAGSERIVILPSGWIPPASPYSYAIRSGDLLFLSGLIPRNPRDNSLIPGDINVQTRAVVDNARAILEAAGLGLGHIASARVYLTDVANFQPMNAAYREFFPVNPPARATVRTPLVHPNDLIEITFTAAAGAPRAAYTTPAADGTPGQPNPNLSSAIVAGSRVFVSGMLGVVTGVPPDVTAQAKETLDRLGRTLAAAGAAWSDVVEATVYVTDVASAGAVAEAVRARIPTVTPTVVGTGLVVAEGRVEIMLTALK